MCTHEHVHYRSCSLLNERPFFSHIDAWNSDCLTKKDENLKSLTRPVDIFSPQCVMFFLNYIQIFIPLCGCCLNNKCHILNSYNKWFTLLMLRAKMFQTARDWSGPCKIFLQLSPLEVWFSWTYLVASPWLYSNHRLVHLTAVQPASPLTEIMDCCNSHTVKKMHVLPGYLCAWIDNTLPFIHKQGQMHIY